jgi:hypothetical protein
MSKDHRHLYAVERMGNYNGIIGYQVSAPAEPDIFGIFTIKDDDLIICDRAARLGYPTKFSADEGTLLLLRRYASTNRTNRCTEPSSLRDFCHVGCGAAFGANGK